MNYRYAYEIDKILKELDAVEKYFNKGGTKE